LWQFFIFAPTRLKRQIPSNMKLSVGIFIAFLLLIIGLTAFSSAGVVISGTRSRNRRAKRKHASMIARRLNSTIISIWDNDFRSHYRNIDTLGFCRELKNQWFHNYTLIHAFKFTTEDLAKVDHLYRKHIYIPRHFIYTWRGDNVTLNVTSRDVHEYYRTTCLYDEPYADFFKMTTIATMIGGIFSAMTFLV